MAAFPLCSAPVSADGMKPIEEVRKGDWVWSVAPETGDPEFKQVEDVFVNETDEIVHVRYGDTEIDATPNHPFYVAEKGWVSAVNLRAGDRLQLVNGEYVTVEQVQHEILESPVKIYNFEVQDNHTYYVGGDDDDSAVLVHNKCKGIEPPRDRGGLRRKMDKLGNKPVGNYQAHHGIPWHFKDDIAKFGIDVNDVRFGIWTKGKIHQKWSKRYDGLWKDFLYTKSGVLREDLSAAEIVRYFNKLNNKKVKL